MLSSPKIHTCNAQLPENSHSQYSALIKFTFTKLSYHKINFQKSQLSSHNSALIKFTCPALTKFTRKAQFIKYTFTMLASHKIHTSIHIDKAQFS